MAAAPMGLNDFGDRDGAAVVPNPYAGYGAPVAGPEFVGREDELRSMRSRTFASLQTASVTIVGPPRVGKSSLAKQVLDLFAVGTSPAGLRFVPVWITVSGCDSEQSLFRELVHVVQMWLVDHDAPMERLEPRHDAFASTTTWDDMRLRLRTYLREVRALGYQIVAVLDEFDAARNIFHRAAPFELLRAVAYEPDVRVALITTSRRDLAEIVVRSTPEVSTFPQIFGVPVTPGCFGERELAALIERSPVAGDELRAPLHGWLTEETGGQPFLASALLSVLHDRWEAEGGPPEPGGADEQFGEAVAVCSRLIVRHHEQMLELLREENRLGTLLEVLFGPQLSATPADAVRLRNEGVIRATDDGWAAFSVNFQQYLGLLERTMDDWGLWQVTETRLRAALAAALETVYGDIWEIRLAESQGRLVKDCESRRRRARRGFTELAPDDNLLEYTYPAELKQIIMLHWAQLAPILGQSREAWGERLDLLAQVRTPMAHNRRSGPPAPLMERFRSSCQEILKWLPEPPGGAMAGPVG
ncbi:Cdc6/Cdc18 family protein [Actinomadura algeriensis]|uniref:AAA ATPase-like protein n=1 Tax=Actinomadura algeriensis TaxID=1679523 RepID=A0ABR9K297_9ACTN|nr:ATP-binding protein [Actinomadura algeriensis]MBE1536714.1 hypothetical protein [Actinomadura algeriensis]